MDSTMKKSTKTLALLFSAALLCAAVLLNVPAVQDALLALGGSIRGRMLNHPEVWLARMRVLAAGFVMIAAWTGCLALRPSGFAPFAKRVLQDARTEHLLVSCGVIAIALAASQLFNTSPLHDNPPATDSAVFMYIGKGMHRGLVPYKDMFDHKGIFLYFIDYLGTFLDGNAGIYLIELAGMLVATLFTVKTAALAAERAGIRLLAAFFVLCVCGGLVYEGGNLTETYALPCLAYANYVFLKCLKTGKCRFGEFFFSGIAFAIVLLLRVNMVAPWAFFCIYLLVIMARKREFGNVRTMVAGLACGAVVVIVPSLAYLLATDSLGDMWECYVMFNFRYISDAGGLRNNIFAALRFMALLALPVLCMAATLLKKPEGKQHGANMLAFLVTLFFVAISGRGYRHYAVALLPFCALPVAYVLGTERPRLRRNWPATALGICVLLAAFAEKFPARRSAPGPETLVRFLREETAQDADVLVLGNGVAYNIQSNRVTKQRFFYQRPVAVQNPAFLQSFKRSFFAAPPDYVVVPGQKMPALAEGEGAFNDIFAELSKSYTKRVCSDGDVYVRAVSR